MPDTMMVAVYGTLKQGMINHRLLEGARYVGSDLLTSICLYDLGDYPGALMEQSDGVHVEIYEVTASHLNGLDQLEECDPRDPEAGLYRRGTCQTRHGTAWIYIFNRSVAGLPRMASGSWTPTRL